MVLSIERMALARNPDPKVPPIGGRKEEAEEEGKRERGKEGKRERERGGEQGRNYAARLPVNLRSTQLYGRLRSGKDARLRSPLGGRRLAKH